MTSKSAYLKARYATAYIILAALMICCQGRDSFRVPRVQTAENGWENYIPKIDINKETAEELKPGQDSPEAAVVHFYASMIRKDNACLDVLPPSLKPSDEVYERVQEIKEWTFNNVELWSRKEFARDRYWILIHMEIEFQGKSKSGEDEVEVQLIGGKWCVVRPPL